MSDYRYNVYSQQQSQPYSRSGSSRMPLVLT